MLFSPKERGQGVVEFVMAILLLFLGICAIYMVLQKVFFPEWPPIYELFG